LASHQKKKEVISPAHDYFFDREVSKVGINIIQGQWNGSGRPGDRKTTACCLMPEKLADAISEILSFEKFLGFVWIIHCFTASA